MGNVAIVKSNVTFNCTLMALLVAGNLWAAESPAGDDLRVNGERLNATMEHMKTFGMNEAGGSARVAFSDENRAALAYLSSLMSQAGLETRIDVAGNLVGRREGKTSGLAPIVSGSHVDTVPNGGHYDGVVGVMSAIEVARALHEAGFELDHPLEIVVWSNEEGGKTAPWRIRNSTWRSSVTLPSAMASAISVEIRSDCLQTSGKRGAFRVTSNCTSNRARFSIRKTSRSAWSGASSASGAGTSRLTDSPTMQERRRWISARTRCMRQHCLSQKYGE
jgi:hypothetical protein